MKPRVTQKDVAKKAGVSHVAVSLALRNHHSIPAKTRERIKKVARKIGYSPDPMLSSLSVYRLSQRPSAYQSNIAWINTWKKPAELYSSISFSSYFSAAAKRSKELGYQLEEFRLADFRGDVSRMEKALHARGITGILLPPAEFAGSELHMDFSGFSAVRLGYSWQHPVLFTVTNAQFRTTLNMVKKLVDLGYQRIGMFLPHDLNDRSGWNFIGGFSAGQQFISAKNRIPPMLSKDNSMDKLSGWIQERHLDAVISTRSFEKLRRTGLKVGYADIAVHPNEFHITGMFQNDSLIGKTAIDSLTAMMHRGEKGISCEYQHLLIESVWNPGKTAPGIL